ncbi:MAG: hypothetical protein J6A59_08515 [Lachnospiraceae bacterium]|nr:hypothetical protein [Lachnospiraceae bacterium]
MKNRQFKQLIAVLSSVACLMTSGCSAFISEDATSYPLEQPLTQQEVVDYYARALDYDSIVTRNIEEHKTTYVTHSITGEKAERLKLLTEKAELILGQDEYEISEDNLKVVSPDTFEYIKGTLDNVVLTDGNILDITGALGYYFVDVEYTLSEKTPGSFNYLTSLIGLNGAFFENYDGSYSLDVAYMETIVKELNKYFYDNNIITCAAFDKGTNLFQVIKGVEPDISFLLDSDSVSNLYTEEDIVEDDIETTENIDENIDTTEGTVEESTDATEDVAEDTSSEDGSTPEESDETESVEDIMENEAAVMEDTTVEDSVSSMDSLVVEPTYNSIVAADRKIQFDTSLINSVVGSSLRQQAVLPGLDIVYNKPEVEGEICGNGIYIAGGNGLKVFGFNRDELTGTTVLRYVFKDDVNGTGEIFGTNVFVVEQQITNGINIASNNVLIPEFLMTEFEKLIERHDRVNSNCDLSGMMSGHLYEDMGFGVLRGYKDKATGIHKYMSTIRQVINRDTTNNSYLLEVETTVIEGAKDVDCYGTYRDKYYIVVQQQGNEFVIVDQVLVSRDCVVEPPINPDSTVQKRLVALNLAGEIPDESKEAITQLMSDLYTAGTNRLLYGPKDMTVNGEVVTIEKGMYDCFQNDTSILSEDKLEYMNSQLRNVLIRNGTDITSIHRGTVTEWIGGYENQAEFTTEELVTYQGKGEAYYMQVYYLVSKLNDVWVIDERTILDEKEVTEATEISNIESRVTAN